MSIAVYILVTFLYFTKFEGFKVQLRTVITLYLQLEIKSETLFTYVADDVIIPP